MFLSGDSCCEYNGSLDAVSIFFIGMEFFACQHLQDTKTEVQTTVCVVFMSVETDQIGIGSSVLLAFFQQSIANVCFRKQFPI